MLHKLIDSRPDEVRRGIDKAARTADTKTGGRYSSQITRGARAAGKYVEGRSGHKGQSGEIGPGETKREH